MKTLPLGLAGLGARAASGNEPGHGDEAHDFSAMLHSQPADRQPLPARPRPPVAAAPRQTPRQDDSSPASLHDTAPRPRAEAHAPAREGRGGPERQNPARPAPARREDARADPASGKTAGPRLQGQQAKAPGDKAQPHEDKPGQTTDATQTTAAAQPTDATQATATAQPADATQATAAAQPADAPWPPAGLGGLETVLAASAGAAPQMAANGTGPVATLPGSPAQAAPAAPAMATAGTPQPALPTLQTGTSAAPLAAAPGVAAAAPGLGDFAAKMAAAAVDQAPSKAVDTLVAGAAGTSDGATAPAPAPAPAPTPDTAALFALHAAPAAHASAARGDAASVFDRSPTPMPHLHEGFDDAVGTRLSWLADQKVGHAHIKIAPEGLGPVEVRLQLDGDKVQANFTSAHAEVRQALEQSIPRLREMLGQHGFQLSHADVGGQQSQNRQASGRGEFAAADGTAVEAAGGVGITATALRQRGLLDAYA